MDIDSKILVAGPNGLVGSAIIRQLLRHGYNCILTPSHSDQELMDQQAVEAYLKREKPDFVFLAAAKVGGILANNTYPADFIYKNLVIQNNIIHSSYKHQVKKLLFLGSSCIYPKLCDQPMKEEYLMTGPLEPTNSPYAVAKIAGIEMCWAYNRQYGTQFLPVMPTNLYGPNDNFNLETSHVLPALLRKFHEAKDGKNDSVVVWGSGSPKREFLHVDDLADACIFLMNNFFEEDFYKDKPLLNIGTGEDVTILELAGLIKKIVGFDGEIVFDASKPDGTLRKLLDISRIKSMGWKPKLSLDQGIQSAYQWYISNQK